MNALWVALGGAAGSLMRYGLGFALSPDTPGTIPWGTLAANLIGCFAIGLAYSLAESHLTSPQLKLALFVGVLGGFTTFSSFALESTQLTASAATAYVVASVLGGLGLAKLGLKLGEALA